MKGASNQHDFLILGVMSGTSVDGLDLALTRFVKENSIWQFSIIKAETLDYSETWVDLLKQAIHAEPQVVNTLDDEFGDLIGALIADFLTDQQKPHFIASHGHTVFHQPGEGITRQIGNGDRIHQKTGIPVIYDFRSLDVSLGGQGAPLVPIGDRDLFADYTACINLGGIANISYQEGGYRKAFDICPMNMALDPLAAQLGQPYDDKGQLAASGQVIPPLADQLNKIAYYHQRPPKSLGLEDYLSDWAPLFKLPDSTIQDVMHTYVVHAAQQISQAIPKSNTGTDKVLLTGGGAFNDFFVSCLRQASNTTIVIPSESIIAYKEAVVFAYLGLLRYLEQPNCLASVTGASQDNMGGRMSGF